MSPSQYHELKYLLLKESKEKNDEKKKLYAKPKHLNFTYNLIHLKVKIRII